MLCSFICLFVYLFIETDLLTIVVCPDINYTSLAISTISKLTLQMSCSLTRFVLFLFPIYSWQCFISWWWSKHLWFTLWKNRQNPFQAGSQGKPCWGCVSSLGHLSRFPVSERLWCWWWKCYIICRWWKLQCSFKP